MLKTKGIVAVVAALIGGVSADELTQTDGKWELFGPMEVGNMELVTSATLNEEHYIDGRKLDMVIECEFEKLEFRIRDYTADLSRNDGAVEYQIDDQPKAVWTMETFKPKEQIVQFNDDKAVDALRQLYGAETLTVFFKLPDDSTKALEFDIAGIEDKLRFVRMLCHF